MVLKQVFHRLPPVTRRDAVIEALKGQRGRPSYYYKFREAQRLRSLLGPDEVPHPVWELNDKIAAYEFARSHGVPIPRVYGRYAHADDIEWDCAPSRFVIKVTRGTVADGVWPLVAEGDHYRDAFDPTRALLARAEITSRVAQALRYDPEAEVLLEEFLAAPPGSGYEIPPDYKLVCFHGTVGLIVAIGRTHRHAPQLGSRYFAADGTDLGDAVAGALLDSRLPVPAHLDDLVAAGEILSGAIRSPHVRVDMYDTPQGVCFGELTPAPGGDSVLREDIDIQLGELWEMALHRLEQEAIDTNIRESAPGPHERRIPISPVRTTT